MTKEKYNQYKKMFPDGDTEEEIIIRQVQHLIDNLFIPVKDKVQWIRDRTKTVAMANEPINWGDLRVADVTETKEGSWIITIDEAAPNECPELCKYIEEHMRAWGWEIICKTEW